MLTAYDYPTAQLLDEAGIPMLLVGDSVGQVILGYETTVRVTMAEMVHHTKAVVRGSRRAMVVADMPFLSYSAARRGDRERRDLHARGGRPGGQGRGRRPHGAGHRGARPCRHPGDGPHRAHPAVDQHDRQGPRPGQDRRPGPLADRRRATPSRRPAPSAMVLELVPEQLAAAITERLRIPTIGIGAGAGCSGQVQVVTDLIGLGDFVPRHARPYAHVRESIREAATAYAADVDRRHVPGPRRDRPHGRRGPRRRPRARSSADRPARSDPERRHPARSRSLIVTSDRRPLDPRSSEPAPSCAMPSPAPRPVGLVPTMGWLHDGHRALIRQARAADATTVVTIFVNPRQFNVAADYTQYPRNEARDLAICESEGVDIVFAPDASRGLPAGLRHDGLGRGGRAAARGRGAARPLRRRRDGRGHPVRPRRRGPRLLRPEGRPAGHGHPPDGARPGHRRPRSSPARPCASRTASPCRHATST